jgi:hypothetical protein
LYILPPFPYFLDFFNHKISFADSTLGTSDPLHFLYKLFAARGQTSASLLGAEEIARWPEVLATLLSNPASGYIDMVRQLGDSVLANGDVCAAHACYLCIEDAVGERLVQLYGAHAGAIPTAESIQRTEVAEYAQSLAGSSAMLMSFLPYKLVYATWLADCSIFDKALDYCDVIGRALKEASPSTLRNATNVGFLRRLVDLVERLKARHSVPRPQSSDLWRVHVSVV